MLANLFVFEITFSFVFHVFIKMIGNGLLMLLFILLFHC